MKVFVAATLNSDPAAIGRTMSHVGSQRTVHIVYDCRRQRARRPRGCRSLNQIITAA